MGTLRTERIDKWVRGRLGDTLVVETRDPLLVWQGGFPPVYGFARDEVAEGVLRPATGSSYPGSCFFGPHLPVAQWYDVVVDDAVVECGAWTLEDLPDRVVHDLAAAACWRGPRRTSRCPCTRATRTSGWRRCTARGTSRCCSVTPWSRRATGRCCCWRPTCRRATTCRARTSASTCWRATDNVSACPYKGTADSYWTFPGPPGGGQRGLVVLVAAAGRGRRSRTGSAFYNELVDLRVDGVLLERPESPFSRAEQRPGGK